MRPVVSFRSFANPHLLAAHMNAGAQLGADLVVQVGELLLRHLNFQTSSVTVPFAED